MMWGIDIILGMLPKMSTKNRHDDEEKSISIPGTALDI
jgi:hypothetical protein